MAGYICMNCGFRVETEKHPGKCPYCDHAELEKEKTADELVNSVKVE